MGCVHLQGARLVSQIWIAQLRNDFLKGHKVQDHVHMLSRIPLTYAVAEVIVLRVPQDVSGRCHERTGYDTAW